MAKVDVLLGLQWGDEGKGKIVDFLAPNYQVIARFQGDQMQGIPSNLKALSMFYTRYHQVSSMKV